MRLKIDSDVYLLLMANIFDEKPNVLYCLTATNVRFKINFESEDMAYQSLESLLKEGYLEVDEDYCSVMYGIESADKECNFDGDCDDCPYYDECDDLF